MPTANSGLPPCRRWSFAIPPENALPARPFSLAAFCFPCDPLKHAWLHCGKAKSPATKVAGQCALSDRGRIRTCDRLLRRLFGSKLSHRLNPFILLIVSSLNIFWYQLIRFHIKHLFVNCLQIFLLPSRKWGRIWPFYWTPGGRKKMAPTLSFFASPTCEKPLP